VGGCLRSSGSAFPHGSQHIAQLLHFSGRGCVSLPFRNELQGLFIPEDLEQPQFSDHVLHKLHMLLFFAVLGMEPRTL
jgi:hypothetical protein